MIGYIICGAIGFFIGFFIGVQPRISRTAEAIVDSWDRGGRR